MKQIIPTENNPEKPEIIFSFTETEQEAFEYAVDLLGKIAAEYNGVFLAPIQCGLLFRALRTQSGLVSPSKSAIEYEESAYRDYRLAAEASGPYSEQEHFEKFERWHLLWKQLGKGDRALLLLQRIAERYPPARFMQEDQECLFCGWIGYSPIQHSPDCIAVLMQEFK